MSDHQRRFADTMAAARGWRDRITAGKGLSVSG